MEYTALVLVGCFVVTEHSGIMPLSINVTAAWSGQEFTAGVHQNTFIPSRLKQVLPGQHSTSDKQRIKV